MLHVFKKGTITLISAMSKNKVIGKNNTLPWRLPQDLKRFQKLTKDNVVVMGRKTYQSIGKSLPNRLNIILTRDTKWNDVKGDQTYVYHSIEEVLERFKTRDLFIIGGSEIYKSFMDHADKIELTLIEKEIEGDTYFPEITSEWKEENKETHENEDFTYHFITYLRKTQ
jgi:dihydrofolate reductase